MKNIMAASSVLSAKRSMTERVLRLSQNGYPQSFKVSGAARGFACDHALTSSAIREMETVPF